MQLKLLSDDDSVAQVRVSGRIAPDSFSRDNEPLAKLLGPSVYERRLLMSLEDTDYINSSGVGWLLVCHKRFRESGGRLVIHSMPKLVRDVFEVLRMDRVFNLATDAAEARRLALQDQD